MEHMNLCQSCAMPMGETDEVFGTNADGSKNPEYCTYCYQEGAFTSKMSMDQMIDFCVPHMVAGNEGMAEDTAKQIMQEVFPKLKRWQEN